MPIRYSPRTKHSAEYYNAVLFALLDGLDANMSDAQIAQLLNDRSLSAATGAPWTAVTVKNALYSVRNPHIRSSRLYTALLELSFAGVITGARSWLLFRQRRVRGVM